MEKLWYYERKLWWYRKNYDTLEKTMIPYQRLKNCGEKQGIMKKKLWNYSKLQ